MAMSMGEFEGKDALYKSQAAAAMRDLALRDDVDAATRGLRSSPGAFAYAEGAMGSAWGVALQGGSAELCEGLGAAFGREEPAEGWRAGFGRIARSAFGSIGEEPGGKRVQARWGGSAADVGRNVAALMAGLGASGAPALDFVAAWIAMESGEEPKGNEPGRGVRDSSLGWASSSARAGAGWLAAWERAGEWIQEPQGEPEVGARARWLRMLDIRSASVASSLLPPSFDGARKGEPERPEGFVADRCGALRELQRAREGAVERGWLAAEEAAKAPARLGEGLGQRVAMALSAPEIVGPEWREGLAFLPRFFEGQGAACAQAALSTFARQWPRVCAYRMGAAISSSMGKAELARLRHLGEEAKAVFESAIFGESAKAPSAVEAGQSSMRI